MLLKICRREGNGGEKETKPCESPNNVTATNEREKRLAEQWAKDNSRWIPFVGFTGFEGRMIMPVLRQRYIKDCVPATNNEIDCYMAALGFEKESVGRFYNIDFRLSDVLPKNVLKDESGDIYVIDMEISLSD